MGDREYFIVAPEHEQALSRLDGRADRSWRSHRSEPNNVSHLTDRIGNWMELIAVSSFLEESWHVRKEGLLAVTVVEHDELIR
jgi:hypothetical protein